MQPPVAPKRPADAAPPSTGAARSRSPAPTIAFACAAMLVSYLPFSAANGALGTIAAATGAATWQLQWVSDAFAVALGATVLSGGVLSDLFGRRRITLGGLLLTALGAATGFAAGLLPDAPAVHLLWAGQAIAGIGGGAVMSATLGMIAAAAPGPAARNRAISWWAASVVAGLGGGPFLAAAVTGRAGWHWLFAPVAAAALMVAAFGARRAAESSAPAGRRLDAAGQTTGAAGIAALTVGVISGGATGWAAPLTLGALALAAAAFAAFVLVERRSASPLLRLELFASGGFTTAGLAAMAVLLAIGGCLFMLSLFFTHQHVDDLGIAVRLGCLFAGNAVASLAAGPLATRIGARATLVGGLALAAAGAATLLTVTGSTGLGGFGWRLAITGAGAGLVMATATAVAVQSAPGPLAGMAGAANNAMRQLGAALGPAVLGAILAARLRGGGDYTAALHTCAAVLTAVFILTGIAAAALFTRKTS
ncbi:MFS transporter [Actinomadura darangshiensis]|uniref:MFS transporter n=1 Tax=Actinomadura darangshiensis TaxID=705336 RepID=A0A4R5B450_9ACTN|nr:MFS transporter [Actinomadura darangshiensis]TDD79549.1 MFS transporter [Actinomadura darangshiensis]